MDQKSAANDSKSSTAIPRFSKLPLPPSKSTTGASSALPRPQGRPASIIGPPQPSSLPSTAPKGHTRGQGSIASLRTKPGQSVSIPESRPQSLVSPTSLSTRNPLGAQSTQTSKTNAISRYGELGSATPRPKTTRNPSNASNASQQENGVHERNSSNSSGPDVSPPISPAQQAIGPERGEIRRPKGPRPSLSDRTIESLSNVPPSPATDRRRSSFFGAQSPITPSRPPSSIGSRSTMPRLNYGNSKTTAIGRPQSPSKRAETSNGAATSSRRSISNIFPTSGQVDAEPAIATSRSSSPTKIAPPISRSPLKKDPPRSQSPFKREPPRPQNPVKREPPRPQSPVKRDEQRSRSPVKPVSVAVNGVSRTRSTTTNGVTTPSIHPPKRSQDLTKAQRRVPVKPTPLETQTNGDTKGSASSSVALRQQIANAKAAARAAASKEKKTPVEESPVAYNSDQCEDPFNTGPRDDNKSLLKRMDDARRDGRLNIAAIGVKAIPDEVMQMYEEHAMAESSVTWSETVDLIRLIAADNDIEVISEEVFPDKPPETLADDPDSKGNQFGGLEVLDLHGNKLPAIPPGLRRLERLTTLNLSRNNLDSYAFDVIAEITSLRDLSLAHNSLTNELPETIALLSNLQHLDVSHNRLTALPQRLRSCQNLRSLDISHNRLTSSPMDILSQLPQLTNLTLASNALTGSLFPSSVTNLPALQNLDVSDNALATLTFGRSLTLPALTRLDISRNRLGAMPDISGWISLTSLLAEQNCLGDLPRGMTSLTQNLRMVNLERNDLRGVDEGVVKMEGLDRLMLAGNPLRERRLVGMETEAVKRELARKVELAERLEGKV
ncbi:MAG: hypothetical protein M1831_000847 [Alyxoria varia]|nr:MAG: hypothetical protein M1831_000847 [Alyxoria varia]